MRYGVCNATSSCTRRPATWRSDVGAVGRRSEPFVRSWESQDALLYALSVGAARRTRRRSRSASTAGVPWSTRGIRSRCRVRPHDGAQRRAGLREAPPFVLAYVELDEGPRMMTNIVGCDPDAVVIGMPVRAVFDAVDGSEGTAIPRFVPA